MKKELYELISARKAREDVLYIYNGTVYAYGKIKRLNVSGRRKTGRWYTSRLENTNNRIVG